MSSISEHPSSPPKFCACGSAQPHIDQTERALHSFGMRPTLQRFFDDYAQDHRHPMNRLTHKIAIPLIVFHIMAMLDWVKLGPVVELGGLSIALSLGHISYVLTVLWYLTLHVPLALIMALLTALTFPIAAVTPKPVVIAIAVVGWLVQLAGHS